MIIEMDKGYVKSLTIKILELVRKRLGNALPLRHGPGSRRRRFLRRLDEKTCSTMLYCNDGFCPVSFLVKALDEVVDR